MLRRFLVVIPLALAILSIDRTTSRVSITALAIPSASSAAASASSSQLLLLKSLSTSNIGLTINHPSHKSIAAPSMKRGGATTLHNQASTTTTSSDASPPPPPPAVLPSALTNTKRVRITALDGIRALLALHIVLGHFLRYANPPAFLLEFFAQVNVTVGAFFALSGYVTAYTSTEVGQLAVSSKVTSTPSQKWWLSKVMTYYPMHWLVCILFSPMFIYSDVSYGGWFAAFINGLLSLTLTQAWAPGHAEVWNAPTWYLSSMTFSTALMPFALPKISTMNKSSLRKTMGWLVLVNLLPVVGYCLDGNVWNLVEGMTPPKNHPALAIFNYQRFLPIFNVAEVFMGVVACRLAMIDSLDDTDEGKTPSSRPIKTTWLSSTIPLVGLFAVLALRTTDLVPGMSDLLVRAMVFTPLFLKFVMGAHRNTVRGVSDPVLTQFLSSKLLVWLGGLSFPIYILHGPLGQVFYKKIIAKFLWGKVLFGPTYFVLYMSAVLLSAVLLNTYFLQNKAVTKWSAKKVDQLASWL